MDDMTCDDFSTTIKCVVLGNGMVGKSTLAKLFCQGIFTDTYKKTIGVDFMEKQFEVEELAETVHMMIWDTAGQEEFNSLTTRYYKGAGAAVLVFSTTDRESFQQIESWHQKIIDECGEKIAIVLVENKMDMVADSTISPEEVEALATKLCLKLYRTSCKRDINVKEVFEYLATTFITKGYNHGNQAVASIGEIQQQTQEQQQKASGSGSGGQSGSKYEQKQEEDDEERDAGKASSQGGGSSGNSGAERRSAPSSETPIRLDAAPSKVRTKGKKRGFCAIL